MTLSELLAEKFRGDIRFRGEAYVKSERVEITRITPDQVFAVVRDGSDFQTQLTRAEERLQMFCSCSAGAAGPVHCKHLWATIVAVEEGGLLTGPVRNGSVPAFTYVTSGFAEAEIDWEDDDSDEELDAPVRTASSRATARPARKIEVKLRPWEQELRAVGERMAVSGAARGSGTREREVVYEIDTRQSRETGTLVVQTSQRQRRANGQWGKLKPLKIRAGQLDDIENAEDRKLLAYLSGGMPERSNWFAQQSETQATSYRYRVPFELGTLVLPMMCATGRVRYLEQERPQPLAWDEGAPWELVLRVSTEAPSSPWNLKIRLARDGQELAPDQTELLLPGGLVLTREHISLLRDFDAFAWVEALRDRQALEVPPGDEHDLIERLLDMPSLPRLDLPPELKLEEVRGEPVPQLLLSPPGAARWEPERLKGEVRFEYLGELVRGSSGRWAIVQREKNRCLIRDRSREEALWNELQEAGFRRLLDRRRHDAGHDVEIGMRNLGQAVRELISRGWSVLAGGKQVRQAAAPEFRIQTNLDWFELSADVDFEGRRIQLPELLAAIKRGETTIRLDDGSLGLIPEEWLKQYGLFAGLGERDGDHLRFSRNQAAILDALLANQSVAFDDAYLELHERFRNFRPPEEKLELPEFHGTLRPYQRDGLAWLDFLQSYGLGGCLADDMGLGKTVQLIALLQERVKLTDEQLPSLIVVPKSLLFNWKQECERFAPELRVLEYSGLQREALRAEFSRNDVILTTYGTLRRDIVELREFRFDYIVLDEAQTIKNASSQIAKASRLLRSNHRVALSGTPIENHLGDLWSIFEFLNPGMLGRSSLFRTHATDPAAESSRRLLAQGLRPFILRRTKKEVANELPDKFEQTILCTMGKRQRQQYEELRDHYRDSLLGLVKSQGLAKTKMHVLEALLRLRQAACHPGLLDPAHADAPSAKLDVLIPDLRELLDEGHKALVFSQFTSMLALVRKSLDALGIPYEYLDGKTRNRRQVVERFQNDPECGLFLISLKAGGLGLNLTAADYVFLLDPWWNPAVEAQAIDRAHRVGQTRHVFAYRLICRDTVEEKIAALQQQKQELADAILEADNANLIKELSLEDLELLFS